MRYNIYLRTQIYIKNLLDISEDNLMKIIENHNFGRRYFSIDNEHYLLDDFKELQIFTFKNEIYTKESLDKTCKEQDLYERDLLRGIYIPPRILSKFGKNVTDKFIKGDFGYLSEQKETMRINGLYVAKERIQEIRQIKNSNFDFTKLVKMLEELNIAYSKDMVYTVAILVRAIKDHLPPIFSKKDFKEVANSRETSIKASFLNLEKSLKNIADAYMHLHIRKKENLPNMIQVDFKNDLDVLLQEIVRVNK